MSGAKQETTMERHTLISGEVLEFEAGPQLADFLARVRVATNDPSVSLTELTELIYGEENPLLERGIIPGRGVVTKAAFENPAYHALLDLIDQKRIVMGELNPEAAKDGYTMTVAEAADRLGVTTAAVRQAIGADRIDGEKVGGQWRVRPSSVEAYASTPRRGPVRQGALEVIMGNQPGCSLSVHTDGTLEPHRREKNTVHGQFTDWQWGAAKLVNKSTGTVRCVWFQRDDEADIQTFDTDCGLHARGRVKVVRTEDEGEAAAKAFRAMKGLIESQQFLESGFRPAINNGSELMPLSITEVDYAKGGAWAEGSEKPTTAPFRFGGPFSVAAGGYPHPVRCVRTERTATGLRYFLEFTG